MTTIVPGARPPRRRAPRDWKRNPLRPGQEQMRRYQVLDVFIAETARAQGVPPTLRDLVPALRRSAYRLDRSYNAIYHHVAKLEAEGLLTRCHGRFADASGRWESGLIKSVKKKGRAT